MTNDLIDLILPSIENFYLAGYWIAFFAALLETTIGIGLLLPGSTIILLLGAFSAQGYLDTASLIWFAVAGAILGDNLNYYLGRKYGASWMKGGFWFLNSGHIEKTRNFMESHGAKSVFLGRFIPGAKEVVPFIAGSVKMNRATFLLWNILGAIGWGFEWVFAGFLFAQSLNLAQLWLSRAGLFLAFLVILGILFYLLKWLVIGKGQQFWLIAVSLWHSIKQSVIINEHAVLWTQKHPRLISFLQARLDSSEFSGFTLSAFIFALVSVLALFGGVVEDLITSDPIIAVDIRLANLIAVFRTEVLTSVFSWITLLGKSQVVVGFIVITSVILWVWKRQEYIVPLFIAITGSTAFTYLGKLAFHRARPELRVYAEHSFSFPSGHATIAVAFYGFVGYVLIRHVQSWRKKVNLFFATVLLIATIGVSRIYLGEHYFSDVWGGYLAGAIWLIIAISFSEWRRHQKPGNTAISHIAYARPASFALVVLAVLYYVGFSVNYHPPLKPLLEKKVVTVLKSIDVFSSDQMKYSETISGEKNEPVNFIFITDNDQQLILALKSAGWLVTDKANLSAFFSAVKSLILKKPHPSAPLVPAFWNAKTQDLSFARVPGTNWFGHAQHLKVWKTNYTLENGRGIYIALANATDGLKWGVIPKATADLASERERLYQELNRAGKIASQQKIPLVKSLIGKNLTGEAFFSDGQAYIIKLQ